MKIANQLILFFALAIVLLVAESVAILHFSKAALFDTISNNTLLFAEDRIGTIDTYIERHLQEIRLFANDSEFIALLEQSNKTFDLIESRDVYIATQETVWQDYDQDTAKKELTWHDPSAPRADSNYNEISHKIIETLVRFDEQQFVAESYSRIVATNKYGINVGQSSVTSDYYHADADWWIRAKTQGTFVSDVTFDKRSDAYVIYLNVPILNTTGVFSGVLQVAIPLRAIIRSSKLNSRLYDSTIIELVNKDGKLLYSNVNYEQFADQTAKYSFIDSAIRSGVITQRDHTTEHLTGYARSVGSGAYRSLGWIFIANHDTKEVLNPITDLSQVIYIISLLSFLLLMGGIIFVRKNVSRPLTVLAKKMVLIKQGQWNIFADSPLLDAQNEIGTLAQITHHTSLQLHETLRNLEHTVIERTKELQKFKQTVDYSTGAIGITLPDHTIIYVNKAFEDLTGYSASETMGKKASILGSSKTPQDEHKKMATSLKEKTIFTSDKFVNKRKNGSEYNVELSIIPITEGDEVLFYIQLQNDLTERDKINIMKTNFVSIASHQLKTPSAQIKGLTENMLAGVTGELTSPQIEYLTHILAIANANSNLIEDLLNVSRLERGILLVTMQEKSLQHLIKQAWGPLVSKAAKKGIVLVTTDLHDIQVRVDSAKMIEAIRNFMDNAIKFSPHMSTVTISSSSGPGVITIRITDQGPGIPEEVLTEIFTHNRVWSGKVTTEGTGVGLYLSKCYIESQKGTIGITHTDDKTTITITIKNNQKV